MSKIYLVVLAVIASWAAAPPDLAAQSRPYIRTCEREDGAVYCTEKPYIKRKVPQPKKRKWYW